MTQTTYQTPVKTRFEQECSEAVQQIRAVLTELYYQLGVDPTRPQTVTKTLGIDKSLSYRLSKLIACECPMSAIGHLPGRGGMDILLNRCSTRGAPDDALAHVRVALDRFDQMVARHAGTRDRLELIVDSMGYSTGDEHLLASRQLAFRGNSGVCGVQARTRLGASFIVPGINGPDTLDTASVAGFAGFCRLRADVSWPLFRFASYRGDWVHPSDVTRPELGDDQIPRLLREFCSANLPPLEAVQTPVCTELTLTGGEVGNLGAFDCYYGYVTRGASAYRTPEDPTGEFVVNISLPVERLIFDVHIHKDVPMIERPRAFVYNRAGGLTEDPAQCRDDQLLPIKASVIEVAGQPPVVATPHVPNYPDLARSMYAHLGVEPMHMRCLRLEMPLPPMPSSVVMRWRLPDRP
ncbi:MAG: hypothetical protein KF768_10890 [Phycisphaeraceae bacterium]|nr:hypothetical protein [Phycisphaeraceae bacterium]